MRGRPPKDIDGEQVMRLAALGEAFTGNFIRKTKYYTGVVYEFNLPTGTTCPAAMECRVTVDRETGRFNMQHTAYRCYAAGAERFPSVRKSRWANFDYVKNGGVPVLPAQCKAVRIHASGDFFNQDYFDTWLSVAAKNPDIEFWAYTKSLPYWIARLDSVPDNLVLTASYGGRYDALIEKHGLRNVKIYSTPEKVPGNRPIDINDDIARTPKINFALVDNYYKAKQ